MRSYFIFTHSAGSEGGTTRCEGGEKECQEEEQEPEDEDDLDNADGGAASWLETLGLDKKDYRTLDPNKVKLYPWLIILSNYPGVW